MGVGLERDGSAEREQRWERVKGSEDDKSQ